MATVREAQGLAQELVELGTSIAVSLADGKVEPDEGARIVGEALDVLHALPSIPPRKERLLKRAARLERQAADKTKNAAELRERAAALD